MKRLRKFAVDKTWVVTGAAAGIGREFVRHLMDCGAVVWALDVDKEKLEELTVESKRKGRSLFTVEVDVTDMDAVRKVIDKIIDQSRRIDVWINNAGIQKVGAFTEQSSEQFNAVMRVNFNALVDVSRDLIKVMESQGEGVILNMASVAGHVPAPFLTAYVAAKHAVVGFTRALRSELELLKSPVRCMLASPGFVDTAIIERGSFSGFPEWLSWMLDDPSRCAREILVELAAGNHEIVPTRNGRAMSLAFKFLPELTVKSSRLLLTRSITDAILNRYHIPRSKNKA
jgi:short-subunit dehydrogenase